MVTEILLELSKSERDELKKQYQQLYSKESEGYITLDISINKILSESSAKFHNILLQVNISRF